MTRCEECGKRMIFSKPVAEHNGLAFCSRECAEAWGRRHIRPNTGGAGRYQYVDDNGVGITDVLLLAWCMGFFDNPDYQQDLNAYIPTDQQDSNVYTPDETPPEPSREDYSDLPDQPSITYDTGPAVESSPSESYSSDYDSGSSSCDSCDSGGGCDSGSSD